MGHAYVYAHVQVHIKFGEEVVFDDLIHAHEAEHGPLKKYSAAAPESDTYHRSAFHSDWDSSEAERVLYHKITLRIEAKLEELVATVPDPYKK